MKEGYYIYIYNKREAEAEAEARGRSKKNNKSGSHKVNKVSLEGQNEKSP
jgi:hypothetical protein